MTARPATPLLSAVLAELDEADDTVKRQFATQLRPYLADDSGRLLDAGEMAELLQLNPGTLVKMARTGRIWAKKVGREWRFRADRPDVLPVSREPILPSVPSASRRSPLTAPSSFAAIRGRP